MVDRLDLHCRLLSIAVMPKKPRSIAADVRNNVASTFPAERRSTERYCARLFINRSIRKCAAEEQRAPLGNSPDYQTLKSSSKGGTCVGMIEQLKRKHRADATRAKDVSISVHAGSLSWQKMVVFFVFCRTIGNIISEKSTALETMTALPVNTPRRTGEGRELLGTSEGATAMTEGSRGRADQGERGRSCRLIHAAASTSRVCALNKPVLASPQAFNEFSTGISVLPVGDRLYSTFGGT